MAGPAAGMVLIDYGLGNLRSVIKAFERLGAGLELSGDPEVVSRADRLILPGVGAFAAGMRGLRERGLVDPIQQAVARGVPLLGICLGMQLLLDASQEVGQGFSPESGLGLIPGQVTRLRVTAGLRVPHMGWNQVEPAGRSPLLAGVEPGAYAYFVHSYVCEPAEPAAILATTDYGSRFASVISAPNAMRVWGIQFHPEKSQQVGLRILENFMRTR